MRFNKKISVLATAGLASAQTFTSCNPLDKTCPADPGLDQSTYFVDFTKGAPPNSSWSAATGTTISYGSKGAEFTIAKAGQAPTIETDFYIFFGYVEVKMQAAPGTGIVSSIVLESDDLDEIDWEFLGGDGTQAETNYFGKGNTTTYNRAIYYPVSNPQNTMHTYAVNWTSSSLIFSIDGTAVRSLLYTDADGGANYPQTPMKLKLGNWAGGAPGQPAGTVEWAGGATDFSAAPFTMYVESVSIVNDNPGKQYVWSDHTGSYQSIKVVDTAIKGAQAVNAQDSASSSAVSSSTSAASVSKTQSASATSKDSSHVSSMTKIPTPVIAVAHAKNASDANSTTMKTSSSSPAIAAASATSHRNATTSFTNSSSSSSSAGVAQQTYSGASTMSAANMAAFSVFTVAMCFWML
ncbi:hypothetical protein MBLNU457_g0757t1 [Dothideomycetes sp. NU457]